MQRVKTLIGGLAAAVAAAPMLAALSAAAEKPAAAPKPSTEAVQFFETRVRPVLFEKCFSCHGPKLQQSGLRLDSRAAMLKGGVSGPALVPGRAERSSLIQVLHHNGALKMPPQGKLKAEEIAALAQWVKQGAPWPGSAPTAPSRVNRAPHWAYLPVRSPVPPAVRNRIWPKSPIDAFILAGLERKGLSPARYADRRTLIRRATFDLTGLPPTPEEVDVFLADRSPAAWAKVVDRLLASPAYGERWGRHWLDVARYADSRDARYVGADSDIAEAWRYRDWVVDAFNRDLPYDQFIINQIAGDLLPAKEPGGINRDGIVATGFLAIGEWGTGDADKDKMMTDIVDDQINVVSRAFMAQTIACARCHDHKFDPIPTTDYYALAGIFFSTHIIPSPGTKTASSPMLRVPLLSPAEKEQRDRQIARTAELEKQVKEGSEAAYAALAQSQLPRTAEYMLAAWDSQRPPGEQGGLTIEEFASRRGLLPFAVRQWADYLGLGDYRLMPRAVADTAGNVGVHTWRGEPDCPNLVVNTRTEDAPILTFRLPSRSVAVHPGPSSGVAVGWRSPFSGTVRIKGRVADADGAGGDGIAWVVDHRKAGGARPVASGEIPNGGMQSFAPAGTVQVQAGEEIQLLVLPRAEYTCDTTTVELEIAKGDGSAVWSLTRDLVDDPLQGGKGNPRADRYGNAGVWRYYDMAKSSRAQRPAGEASALLARWDEAVAAVAAGRADRAAVEAAAREFAKSFTLADPRSPFWITNRQDEQHLAAEVRASLAKLSEELDRLKKTPLPPVGMALAAQEGGVPTSIHAGFNDARVHLRGSYLRLGDRVPRRPPTYLAGENPPITQGSGRLELARWLASPEHPLTARVMVNRIWQGHFGQGLVRTPGNFGKLGERPTHPELLDHLATEFVRSGWSIKQMHRKIMLSATYQQSSAGAPALVKADPENRLWGRMNRRRLEGEAIRDSLLAVSGRLDRTRGGPATPDFSSPRRTLYEMTIRSNRSGFGPLFDAPDPEAVMDSRIVSTVAPQALFMLNHPFALEQTRALAKRLLADGAGDDRARMTRAYSLLYGRPPTAEETQIGLGFLAPPAPKPSSAGPSPDAAREQAWTEYCQILLCANEFVYVD